MGLESGVLIVLKPKCFWRDPVAGKTYVGAMGKDRPASPPFRVSAERAKRLVEVSKIAVRVAEKPAEGDGE